MFFLVVFVVRLTFLFPSVFASTPDKTPKQIKTFTGIVQNSLTTLLLEHPDSFKCAIEGNPPYVPNIARCDFRKDCEDGSDEKNCTRHPGAGRPFPREIAEHWTQESIWSLNGSSLPLVTVHSVMSLALANHSLIVTCKRILNNKMFVIENRGMPLLPGNDPCSSPCSTHSIAFLLSSELEEALTWTKGTAGHVQRGAVIAGLSPEFELTFLCRIPGAYLYGEDVRLKPSIGTVRASTGNCSLLQMELRDYEILTHAHDNAGFDCGSGGFNCTESKRCIPSYLVCDGESDCSDGSDENMTLCREVRNCREDEFPCSDGKCIGMDKLCDVGAGYYGSKRNCYDGKDESKETFEQFCQKEKFRCDWGIFIDKIDRCNSRDDCKDFSDERNCTRYQLLGPAFPHQFEVRDWTKGFWAPSEASSQEYFHVASITMKTLLRDITKLTKHYYRRAGHNYGIFSMQCLSRDNNICNIFVMENGTIAKAIDTNFETLQQAPHENRYEWVKGAKGHIPDGALMLGMTPSYEPLFICRKRSRPSLLNSLSQFGILIPSQSKCRSVDDGSLLEKTVFSDLWRKNQLSWDYAIVSDSSHQLKLDPSKTIHPNFSCGSHGEYIEPHLVCDGEWDCTDGKDEEIGLCREQNNCTDQQFPCSDGKCIPLNLACRGRNGKKNCLDGNDQSPRTCPNILKCKESEIQCGDGRCIKKPLICNGIWDCEDGSDEISTYCEEQLNGSLGFQCKSGQRLSYNVRCDNLFQCDDRSDEKACGVSECVHETYTNSHECNKGPYKLDEIQLKQGLWLPSPEVLNQPAPESRFEKYADYSICRLMDTKNGSSRAIVGSLSYEHNQGRVLCVAGEIWDAAESEALPFEILHEDAPAAYIWPVKPNNRFTGPEDSHPDGILIGGLTDEYEIFFVCRPWNDDVHGCGSMRPRLNICVLRLARYFTLRDARYSK